MSDDAQRTTGEDSLAREVAELARRAPDRIPALLADLSVRDQAELCLRLAPAERLQVLLHAPKPMRLARSLPDIELYLTVREVGPVDGLPLVSLASAPQLQHLMDLESWRHEGFDAKRSGAWVALLLEAGEPTVNRFLRQADDELLALLFRSWAGVRQIEWDDTPDKHGAGETESGTEAGFLSPDGYHRFSPVIPEHAPAVRRLAELLAAQSPARYQRIVWQALWEVPLELEEQAARWRRSRLEEHGFPDFEEALSAYAPPAGTTAHPEPPAPSATDELTAPRTALRILDADHPLPAAVARLSGAARERALHEIAALANRLLVADAADPGDPQTHRNALRKAGSYVRIALAARGARDDDDAAAVLRTVPVLELFQEGLARAVQAQQRARRLTDAGWAAVHERALELLDPPIHPTLMGLLQPRPLFFDARASAEDRAYRDFATLEEIDEARAAVQVAEILGRVFVERLGTDVPAVLRADDATPFGPPRFSTLFLTALAWNAGAGELRSDPLPQESLARFLRTVASRRTAAPDAAGRALGSFVDRLASELDLSALEVSSLQAFGRACLERLDQECGALDPGRPVDPLHVSCLMVQAE